MWLFSKDVSSVSSLPYNRVADSDIKLADGWVLYACLGKRAEECSMFVHDSPNAGVVNALKRMRTLKHPDLISYIDGLETAKEVCIVTERVQPLEKYLKEKADSGNFNFMTSWGIYELLRALTFLSDRCHLRHYSVRMSSVFVTRSGDWKLAGFDRLSSESDPAPFVDVSDAHWPPDGNHVDAYGFGALIWEVFNGPLHRRSDLQQPGRVPSVLSKLMQRMTHQRSAMRTEINAALQQVLATGGFCDNFYVKTLLFLEEMQLKDTDEKQAFMSSLSDQIESFPDDVAKHKILPHLLQCHQYGATGIEVLVPLIKLGKLLDRVQFESNVVPCLVQMFRSSNRATRVRLLEQLPSFVEYLPNKVVDTDVFPAVITGIADTNPIVREATVRAVVHLAPKLGYKQLNETLVRQLGTLQLKDDQGGIRTNATVCIAKIAHLLSPSVRQSHVLTVLLKCTRDPFVPARTSAVSALTASMSFMTTQDIATRLLPCLSFLTVDEDEDVRRHTFYSMRQALDKLESFIDNDGGTTNGQYHSTSATGHVDAVVTWTDWAAGLSARFLKKGSGSSTIPLSNQQQLPYSCEKQPQKEPSPLIQPAVQNVICINSGIPDGWNAADEQWDIPITISNAIHSPLPQETQGWQNDDPDAFFEDLIRETSPIKTKKSLKLGKTTDQGNQTNRQRQPKQVMEERNDGWGDTDW